MCVQQTLSKEHDSKLNASTPQIKLLAANDPLVTIRLLKPRCKSELSLPFQCLPHHGCQEQGTHSLRLEIPRLASDVHSQLEGHTDLTPDPNKIFCRLDVAFCRKGQVACLLFRKLILESHCFAPPSTERA